MAVKKKESNRLNTNMAVGKKKQSNIIKNNMIEKKKPFKNIKKKEKPKFSLLLKTVPVEKQEPRRTVVKETGTKTKHFTETSDEKKKWVKPPIPVPKSLNSEKKIEEIPFLKGHPDWTINNLLMLVNAVDAQTPETDILSYNKRINFLDWNEIARAVSVSPEDSKRLWKALVGKVQVHRTLHDLVNDAKVLVRTHTEVKVQRPTVAKVRPPTAAKVQVKSKKSDARIVPKNQYEFFFLDAKTQILRVTPFVQNPRRNKHVKLLFNKLPEEEKQKYIKMAEEERKACAMKVDELKKNEEVTPEES